MLFNFIGGGAPPAPGPVQSRLALSHLAIRFRVSPPFFPLLFIPITFNASLSFKIKQPKSR